MINFTLANATFGQIIAIETVRHSFAQNLAELQDALAADTGETYVAVWTEHMLGVQFDGALSARASRVDTATPVSVTDLPTYRTRYVRNGRGERPTWMIRRRALELAVAHQIGVIANFEASLAHLEA